MVSKVDRLTRSVAFLSKLLEAHVDVRFAATGVQMLRSPNSDVGFTKTQKGSLSGVCVRARWVPASQ